MLKFAFKNMAIKKVQIILIVLSIVISAGIGVLAFNVATQVDEGITSGAQYYSAIIGPAGSNTQLAMNTMYFADSPIGTIPYYAIAKDGSILLELCDELFTGWKETISGFINKGAQIVNQLVEYSRKCKELYFVFYHFVKYFLVLVNNFL